ncbi:MULTISPECIES: chemotaxis protein CheW [unclassified Candidatus Frackibacter]|uniref:chemotaxis protein CheW n=1 Tax=unclassified Candidatus Frackibacter TaxID=2648818 RepID=UPI0007969790|nr:MULTISPECIES: chemotaxis protein CheW [unclassified Candidatus Frackibacter]KXS41899.1 MAG: purine-binding chemotaxis protein CheW [Candidatus Frackibacter sp. T328-2]SDB99185.1 purine-binding chemotaxis protein CheW [Candidatus Frackibacter sp. WG11]SEM30849.1 purine-binding chemotaxis protein CheW [Candidatus Frackibacter sp. WG12]SFL35796.1 purine-binding chemotaxis protein CheW [Candidatus Frackibacter sp. WG13]
MQLVAFRLNDEEYGVEILETQEIIEMQRITKIPNAPNFVEGIISLRGEIIPIIDLRKRFNLDISNEEEQRIIIVETEGNKVGMIVDEVKEVLSISKDTVKPPPKIAGGINKKYLEGVIKIDDKLLVLLNLTKILDPEEIKEMEKIDLDKEKLN